MRGTLIGALALAVAFQGCLGTDLASPFDSPELTYETADELVRFSYRNTADGDPPTGEEDTYERGSISFDVSDRSRNLAVVYSVAFNEGPAGTSDEETREVSLELEGPDGEEETVTARSSLDDQWDFEEPSAGTWTVDYEARGEGTIYVAFFSLVPSGDG